VCVCVCVCVCVRVTMSRWWYVGVAELLCGCLPS